MPTYAYRCTACEHTFEIQQAFSDDSLTVCPECSGRLRKVFSAVGVVFKGSGFYRTDSRAGKTSTVGASPAKGTSNGSSDSSAGSSSSGSSSGGDSGGSGPTTAASTSGSGSAAGSTAASAPAAAAS